MTTGGRALLVLVALVASDHVARAQACCSGGGAFTPWRLEHHEQGLVGVSLSATPMFGDFDEDGAYRAHPDGVSELTAEAVLFGSLRAASRLQLAARLPFVLTSRGAGGIDAAGGGLGDLAFGMRWDPLWPGETGGLPGIGLELALTAPSGTAPEDADDPLAVDATGLGAWQLALDVAFEHVLGASRQWLLSARTGLRWYVPRTVHGATSQRDLEGHASLGVALALPSGLVLAVSLDGSWQGDDQHLLGLGLNLAAPLAETWRFVLGVNGTPPIDGLAADRPFGLGLALTFVHTGG